MEDRERDARPARYVVWDVRPDGVAELSEAGSDTIENVPVSRLNALVQGGRFRPAAVQYCLPGLAPAATRGEGVGR